MRTRSNVANEPANWAGWAPNTNKSTPTTVALHACHGRHMRQKMAAAGGAASNSSLVKVTLYFTNRMTEIASAPPLSPHSLRKSQISVGLFCATNTQTHTRAQEAPAQIHGATRVHKYFSQSER